MREQMHPIYTAVPMRSVRAYAKREPVTLEAVLCAAIVDPANAEDAFEEYGISGTPHSLRDFWEWRGATGIDLALQIAAQWTMQQKRAGAAIRKIITWDRLVGVWCACQIAREALRFAPEDEARPRIAIETTERWVVGDATIEEVRAAADAAFAAAADAADAAAFAADAAAAADAADAAAFAAYAAATAADAAYAAYAAATAAANAAVGRSRGQVWDRARNAELLRLREVVAEACLTFPR
jgi:hypothetical protein